MRLPHTILTRPTYRLAAAIAAVSLLSSALPAGAQDRDEVGTVAPVAPVVPVAAHGASWRGAIRPAARGRDRRSGHASSGAILIGATFDTSLAAPSHGGEHRTTVYRSGGPLRNRFLTTAPRDADSVSPFQRSGGHGHGNDAGADTADRSVDTGVDAGVGSGSVGGGDITREPDSESDDRLGSDGKTADRPSR